MKVSERGLAFIAAHEGFVSRGYLDSGGVVTIGYGFTMGSRLFRSWWLTRYDGKKLRVGDPLSREDANRLLLKLLDEEYAPPVAEALPNLTQEQFDACVSVVYNLGPRALSWRWAKALAKGDIAEAARLLSRTGTTVNGRWLPGLVRRRQDEARLLDGEGYGIHAVRRVAPDQRVRAAQERLAALGFRPGSADGIAGKKTRRAVLAFQTDNPPLAIDGRIGPATEATLIRAVEARDGAQLSGVASLLTAFAAFLAKWDWLAAVGAVFGSLLLAVLASYLWRNRGRFWSQLSLSGKNFTKMSMSERKVNMSGWKTLFFNGGVGVVALLAELANNLDIVDLREVLPVQATPIAAIGIGVANIVLRHITNSPAGWRKDFIR